MMDWYTLTHKSLFSRAVVSCPVWSVNTTQAEAVGGGGWAAHTQTSYTGAAQFGSGL